MGGAFRACVLLTLCENVGEVLVEDDYADEEALTGLVIRASEHEVLISFAAA